MINPDRKYWNQQQQILRENLTRGDNHQQTIALFLGQHAMVHSAEMSHAGLWSFEDEVLDGLKREQMRVIPRNGEHSIVWLLWHISRIEDVTMNILIAGSPQVFSGEDWPTRMKTAVRDTGNGMSPEGVVELSAAIDLEALRAYRLSVGRRTRAIARQIQPEQQKMKVDPDRLEQITKQGAVLEAGSYVLEYWGGLTIAGLLLMPPTRHNFIHLNEILRIKQKFR
jgi:hypothetical protein